MNRALKCFAFKWGCYMNSLMKIIISVAAGLIVSLLVYHFLTKKPSIAKPKINYLDFVKSQIPLQRSNFDIKAAAEPSQQRGHKVPQLGRPSAEHFGALSEINRGKEHSSTSEYHEFLDQFLDTNQPNATTQRTNRFKEIEEKEVHDERNGHSMQVSYMDSESSPPQSPKFVPNIAPEQAENQKKPQGAETSSNGEKLQTKEMSRADLIGIAPKGELATQRCPSGQLATQRYPSGQLATQRVALGKTTGNYVPVQDVPVQDVPVQAIPVQAVPVQAVPVQDGARDLFTSGTSGEESAFSGSSSAQSDSQSGTQSDSQSGQSDSQAETQSNQHPDYVDKNESHVSPSESYVETSQIDSSVGSSFLQEKQASNLQLREHRTSRVPEGKKNNQETKFKVRKPSSEKKSELCSITELVEEMDDDEIKDYSKKLGIAQEKIEDMKKVLVERLKVAQERR